MNIALKCLVLSCLTLCSVAAAGDNNRRSQPFLMFTAGTLNVGVVQEQIIFPAPDAPVYEAISIIDEVSLGSLGRATLKTVAKVAGPADPSKCPDGFTVPLVTTEDTIVLTFKNLSQLVGTSTTTVCIDRPGPGALQGISGNGHWVSGTHRFANVTGGEFHLGSTATPQSTNGQFYSTAGSLSGKIERRR